MAEARAGEGEPGGPAGGRAVAAPWSLGSGISRCSEWPVPLGLVVAWAEWPHSHCSGPVLHHPSAVVSAALRQPSGAPAVES